MESVEENTAFQMTAYSHFFLEYFDTFLCVLAGQLTWLVYIIGAVIGGRVSFASTDEHDAMDGELVCR